MNKLSFHNKLVLRTPALPLGKQYSIDDFNENNIIKEALFFASPNVSKLFETFESLSSEKKERLIVTLDKYLIRMSTRCTPFGLFASSSILKIAEQTDIILGRGINRHTRLDMDFLNQIYLKLWEMKEIRSLMTFKPNSTIYSAGAHIKYTECKHIDFIKKHGLAKIDRNEVIDEILKFSSSGKTIEKIVSHLMQGVDFSEEELTGFVHVLIDNHILVSNLEPNITGDHYSQRLMAFLSNIDNSKINEEVVEIKGILKDVFATLNLADQNTVNLTSTYKRLISELKKIDIAVDGDRYFQVDSTKNCDKNLISSDILKKLQRGMKYLGHFQTKVKPNIEDWKQKFKERYADEPVSLLEALDPVIGLGYTDLESCSMPLLQEMDIGGSGNSDPIDHIEDLLLKTNKLDFNEDLIRINKKDLKNFTFSFSSLPDTVTVLFKIIGDKILIKGFGGASGTEYIGRFTHLDDNISQLYKDLTSIEDSNYDHSILAEVLHIPQTKFGNILHRKETRRYEIPILVHTDIDDEYSISPSDLYVKMQDDRLIIFSKKLNCEIEPRISNAYNVNIQAIPIFKFLNDIQSQSEETGYYFDWGDFQDRHVSFPRVEIDDIILTPKKWMFKKENLSDLKESLKDETLFKKFKSKFSIPDVVTISEGDNELLVDLSSKRGIDILKSVSKNKRVLIFVEDLFEGIEQIVFDKDGNKYPNELIAFAINTKTKKKSLNLNADSNIEYNYPFGSSWLYFKIFTSPKAADTILLDLLNPIVVKLFNLGLIQSWFFIRYNVPGFHLRFRVKVQDMASIGDVINEITAQLNQFNSKLIFKIETDTYQREISRYGLNNIDNSELYFFHDSNLAIQFLDIINNFHDSEGLRWQICLLGTHYILEEFGYSLEQKNDLLNYLREAYMGEFDVSKDLKKSINNSFREKSKSINVLFHDESYQELHDIFLLKIDQTKSLVQEIKKDAEDLDLLLMSYIHMFNNRILLDSPRQHELVLYDHLSRYYRSMVARSKKS